MSAPRWVDGDEPIGAIRYLVRSVREGVESWHLQRTPLRTNQTHMPRLRGWCGETNNESRFAEGLAVVAAANKDFTRVRIARPTVSAAEAFLERDGYPELGIRSLLAEEESR